MAQAYEQLRFYQNICEIRKATYCLTEKFDRSHLRLISQMRDAARSAKQNIREGYSKDTIGEFTHAIKISRGSLSELEGDIDDCYEDQLISKHEHEKLKKLLRTATFQIDRYLDSLYKLEKEGKWKSRFQRKRESTNATFSSNPL